MVRIQSLVASPETYREADTETDKRMNTKGYVYVQSSFVLAIALNQLVTYCTCTHTYIPTYIHTYIHTLLHAYMQTCIGVLWFACLLAFVLRCLIACVFVCMLGGYFFWLSACLYVCPLSCLVLPCLALPCLVLSCLVVSLFVRLLVCGCARMHTCMHVCAWIDGCPLPYLNPKPWHLHNFTMCRSYRLARLAALNERLTTAISGQS